MKVTSEMVKELYRKSTDKQTFLFIFRTNNFNTSSDEQLVKMYNWLLKHTVRIKQ